MFCESYRKALSEAAATGGPLLREVRLHLAGCSECAVALAEEQNLFAAIDSAMRSEVNVDVPGSLLPRVRAQMVVSPNNATWRTLVAVLATILLAVGVATFSSSFRWRPKIDVSITAERGGAPAVHAGASRERIPVSVPSTLAMQPSPKPERASHRAAVRPALEVLISPEEQAGLTQYAARLRTRALENSARASIQSDPNLHIKSLEIAEIDLRQLTIEPLDSGEDQ